MRKSLQPEEPHPAKTLVAVQNLIPEMGLLCLAPVDGYPAGTIRPVYGGNLTEETVYTNGSTPPDWRMAVESGDFANEVILTYLPSCIEEIRPKDYPGTYQLVVTDYKLIDQPEAEETEQPECRVIKHPAAPAAMDIAEAKYQKMKVCKLAKKAAKNKDPKQLYFFPEIEPLTATA